MSGHVGEHLDLARKNHLTITAVMETHLHADFGDWEYELISPSSHSWWVSTLSLAVWSAKRERSSR